MLFKLLIINPSKHFHYSHYSYARVNLTVSQSTSSNSANIDLMSKVMAKSIIARLS